MQEHNGENPQNARIKIKYSGKKKPKVSFAYPLNKKEGFQGSMLYPLLMIWFFFNTPLMLYFIHVQETQELKVAFNDTNGYAQSRYYNLSNYSDFLEYYNQPGRINSTYETLTIKWHKQIFKNYDPKGLFFLLYLFGGFFLLYFPFRKKWAKLFPDYQAWLASKKYKQFRAKDLRLTPEGKYYVELPVFGNIICDFKATEHFSKYLDEFEIEEYKFESWGKSRLKTNTIKDSIKYRKEKKKRKHNEWVWYARWYFSEKPSKGFLEVKYA